MKKLLLMMMILLSVPALAQEGESTQQPQLRFGYLSYETILISMPEYKGVQQKMSELREAYEAEMKRVEEEFNRKYEDFLDGQKDFPRTILLKRQQELQEMLQRNIDFKQQGLAEMEQTELQLMAPLRIRLNETIATIARQQGLALVINTDANACPFIEPMMGVDIYEAVLQALMK